MARKPRDRGFERGEGELRMDLDRVAKYLSVVTFVVALVLLAFRFAATGAGPDNRVLAIALAAVFALAMGLAVILFMHFGVYWLLVGIRRLWHRVEGHDGSGQEA